MNSFPLVSIVMPIYNADKYLEDSINSLLKQTYKNIEIILINDCSTDKSIDICKFYEKKYPQIIRLYVTKKRLGFGGEAAANFGFGKSKGKYIAKMDADDIAKTNRIKKQVQFLENNHNVFLCSSHLEVIDNIGRTIGYRFYPTKFRDIKNEFYRRSCIANPCIMFRNENILPFYKLKYKALNDYHTFYYYMSKGKTFSNIDTPLVKYRVYPENTMLSELRKNWSINLSIKNEIRGNREFNVSLVDKIIVYTQTIIINIFPKKIVLLFYKLSNNK